MESRRTETGFDSFGVGRHAFGGEYTITARSRHRQTDHVESGHVRRVFRGCKVVFSRTLERPDWNHTTLVKKNAAATVRDLKKQSDRDIFVFGSANLSETLINDNLFDEYRLAVTPVLLGRGKPLFGGSLSRHRLKLLEARPLTSGGVILRYERDASQ